MAPPKSGQPPRMPPDAGGILGGCPLWAVSICPHPVSRVDHEGDTQLGHVSIKSCAE